MKRKAQIVLESALVLISLTIFLVLVMRTWGWFATQYGARWQNYNSGRLAAGQLDTYKTPPSFVNMTYQAKNLELFK